MQIIESEENNMSNKEKIRALEEALKEADDSFSANGLLEAVNAFCESNDAKAIIQKGQNDLISNMKNIESQAPESVRHVAEELRSAFENDADSFRQDAIANFKLGFHFTVDVMMGMCPDDEFKQLMLETIKKSIHEAGIKDMKEICEKMLNQNTTSFMESVYSQYVPEGMPPEVAAFIRMISGGGPMIPFTAVFGDIFSDDENSEEECPNTHTQKFLCSKKCHRMRDNLQSMAFAIL